MVIAGQAVPSVSPALSSPSTATPSPAPAVPPTFDPVDVVDVLTELQVPDAIIDSVSAALLPLSDVSLCSLASVLITAGLPPRDAMKVRRALTAPKQVGGRVARCGENGRNPLCEKV